MIMIFLLPCLVSGNDPASSWLTYAVYTAPNRGTITLVNTSWVVPSDPSTSHGSNAPGWWYGVQTAEGDGALIQPILAYGYQGSHYSIFNACFDWTDGSWTTSHEVPWRCLYLLSVSVWMALVRLPQTTMNTCTRREACEASDTDVCT